MLASAAKYQMYIHVCILSISVFVSGDGENGEGTGMVRKHIAIAMNIFITRLLEKFCERNSKHILIFTIFVVV